MQIFSRCRHLRLFILIVVIVVSIGDRRAPEISVSFFNLVLHVVDLVDVLHGLGGVVPVVPHIVAAAQELVGRRILGGCGSER